MSTPSEEWNEISTLFETALELPKTDRSAWVRIASDDSKVIRKVLRMLEAEDSGVEFLKGPLEAVAPDLIVDSVKAAPRTRVGPYRLVEEIGRGGMGSVYLGERDDGQFRHRVAVKLLKPGTTSGRLERRFLAERQILASLEHPNIAKLLDGGVTENGEPYFVMEYVEGAPITEYCVVNRCTLKERLELLLEVCEAVSHAHQKLVVHRDLKPSNIHVTSKRRVKLLDFGIAKLIGDEAADSPSPQTQTGVFLLTPEYATPEQLSGEAITTASDVYQIGLLMYELFTGQRPYRFDTHSVTELAHVVCEQEPSKPSTVIVAETDHSDDDAGGPAVPRQSSLKGDLDAITLKALRKEPSERYASVDKLAEDLQRHLDGRPVEATEGTAAYRARKFLRRHRWGMTAAAGFLVLLMGYAGTVTVQQAKTAQERDRAEQYAVFLTSLLASPDPFGIQADVDQRDVTIQTFLDKSVDRIREGLAGQPKLQMDLLGTVGDVYANLGVRDKARPVLEEALGVAENSFGRVDPNVVDMMRRLALATDDLTEADSLYRAQLDLARRLERSEGPLTAKSLIAYGGYLFDVGRWTESDSVLESAMAFDLPGIDPLDAAMAAFYRGQANRVLDRLVLAESLLTIASTTTEQTYGANHPYAAMTKTELAAVIEFTGAFDTAQILREEALAVFEERLGVDHPITIQALSNLAILKSKQGRSDDAETIMRKILDLQTNRYGDKHHKTVGALQNLATFLLKQGRLDDAEPLYHEVSRRYSESLPADNYLHAFPNLSLTEIHLRRRNFEKAATTARAAVEQLEQAFPGGHPLVATAQSRLGAALTGLGKYAEAENMLTSALESFESAEGFNELRKAAEQWLVDLYGAWGKPAQAENARNRFTER